MVDTHSCPFIEDLGEIRLATSGLSSLFLPIMEEGLMIGLHCTNIKHLIYPSLETQC